MRTNENVYLGDGIKDSEKYLAKLKNGKFIKQFFVIAFSENEKTLEIYPSINFYQKYYRNRDLEIVAFTKEQDTALEFIRKVTDISFKKYGKFDPRLLYDSMTVEVVDFLNSEQ